MTVEDTSQVEQWRFEELARIAVASLQRRRTNALYVPDRQAALAVLLEMVPPGVVVGRGDSLTLEQVGILPALKKDNRNKVLDTAERDAEGHWALKPEDRARMQREAFFADVFLTGTNAVTLDGKLVNCDGMGNRVAPMIFGPKKVIVVVGANKIVKDLDEALERIRQLCAPVVAWQHVHKHGMTEFGDLPCVRTGRCIDCNAEWRVCRNTVIIEGTYARVKGRMNVVIVGEKLGI